MKKLSIIFLLFFILFAILFTVHIKDENNTCGWINGKVGGGTEMSPKYRFLLIFRWDKDKFIQKSMVNKECVYLVDINYLRNKF